MRIKTNPEQLAKAFASLEHNESFQEIHAVLKQGGQAHDMVTTMAMYPPLLEAMETLGNAVYPGGSLPRELKELIILQSSINNSCQFCTNSHIDIAKGLGISEDPVKMLSDKDTLKPEYACAIDYLNAIFEDSNRVLDSMFDELRKHFSEGEIVELTFLIGYINMLNWFNNALQVEYRGELASD
ncbi:MAG: carboxymuconolactone decarboxylase family protein [Phycisphaerales bacterium]|jgi:AhpD family alkylhydroperoxidase|nr:carboxymuconolactone decarboxylase family protein [Phycisphaerales bacterium]